MPEMFKPMKLLYGQGLNKCTALITDGRFSGTSNGCFVGHISPEAAGGGPIALIEDGDEIEIDIQTKLELQYPMKNSPQKTAFHCRPKKVGGLSEALTHCTQARTRAELIVD